MILDNADFENTIDFSSNALKCVLATERFKSVLHGAKDIMTHEDIELVLLQEGNKNYHNILYWILKSHTNSLSTEKHWELIVNHWSAQEFNSTGNRKTTWKKIFNLRQSLPSLVEDLSEEFTAYRCGDPSGYSWTLNQDWALWYKNRYRSFANDVSIHERRFNKSDCLFYTNSREEDEVVIFKQNVAKPKKSHVV